MASSEQINVGSRAYLAQHGVPQTPDELKDHLAVHFFSSQTGRDMEWEYRQDGQDHVVPMRSVVSVSSTEAYTASCVAGLGLIQAPRLGLEEMLASGELVEVLLRPGARRRCRWRSCMLHNRHLSARVRVFVDWAASVLVVS
ncbi:LysR substrate-binding domain-containing protein [Massilia sp. B-10]|nr:LysR substrate-binding domain-containing protein [Massilia sp. B-10]